MPNYASTMAANEAIDMGRSGYIAFRDGDQKYADQFAEQFATWMAYNELAGDPKYQGTGELSDKEKDRVKKNAEELAKNFLSSQGYQEMFKPENVKGTIEMLCGKEKTWKHVNPMPLDYETVRENVLGRLKRFDEQREQKRADTKGLVERLKGTTSKSFVGKLKSFFVGNSKEYDKAFEAMQKFSEGKLSPDKAKEAIKNYLDIRKDKVRDHEYGRDRFNLMMQGLQTVMEPSEFAEYCKDVDKARTERSKGKYHDVTHPEDYYPARSAKDNVAEMIQNAKDKQPTMRDAARMAAVYLMTYGDQEDGWEPDRELDPSVIRNQADGIEKDPQFKKWFKEQTPEKLRELMSSEKGFKKVGEFKHELEKAERRAQMQKERAEKNQKYLDTLRKNGKNFSEQDLKDYAAYVGRHPEVREETENIIKEQGLNMKLPEPPKKEQGKGGPDKNVQDKSGQDKGNQEL